MNHALKALIETVGFAWICFVGQAIGIGLLSLVPFSAWLEHREKQIHVLRLLGGAVVAIPLGLLFTVGPWLAIKERLGLDGALLCGGVVLGAMLGFVVPLVVRSRPLSAERTAAPRIDRAFFSNVACAQRTPWSKRLLAGALSLFIAASCTVALFGGQILWIDRNEAASTIAMEFLAIHAGFFLGFVLGVRPTSRPGKGLQWFFFASILCFYMNATIRHSWTDGLPCLLALVGTYGGYLLNQARSDAFQQLAKRWGMSLALFMILAVAMRMDASVDQWGSDNKVLVFAAIYFAFLGSFEIAGLYDRSWRPRWLPKDPRPTPPPSPASPLARG
jgi:hypothetical protein